MEFIIDYEDDYYDDENINDKNSTVKCLTYSYASFPISLRMILSKPNKQVYCWLRFCTDMYRILA